MSKLGKCFFLLMFTFGYSAALLSEPYDPPAVYLTWQRSPETTMTIHWISEAAKTSDLVIYKNSEESTWQKANATHIPMPEGHSEYLIHTVELTGLSPNTAYLFHPGENTLPFKFRTLPQDLEKPLTFVVGGDIFHDLLEQVIIMNKHVMSMNPQFALLGGDIAYATPKDVNQPEKMEKWLDFLTIWKKTMVSKEGDLIPLVPVISNEDTKGRYGQTPAQAPFFYALFAMPGPQGYNVLDFGDYMSIFLLDTAHTHPIEGKQTEWLFNTMKQRKEVPIKFAIYHVPAYPSYRDYNNLVGSTIRRYWVPYFEKYQLTAAFEHHDHAYKRSQLIKNSKIDPTGVLYIGDGGWGVKKARIPAKAADRWYLAQTASTPNVVIVTLYPNFTTYYQAINDKGEIFDTFSQKPSIEINTVPQILLEQEALR